MNTRNHTLLDHVGWRPPLVFAAVGLLAFGLVYSLIGAGLGRVLFPYQATGSLVERDGQVIGSRLLAQPFAAAGYFHPRPSAVDYDPMAAAGSNMARSNPALHARVDAAVARAAKVNGIEPAQVPSDLVTASASGLDPDISPAAARVQVERVAHARGLPPVVVAALVEGHVQPALLGLVGAPHVNVLALNLALDAMSSGAAPHAPDDPGRMP